MGSYSGPHLLYCSWPSCVYQDRQMLHTAVQMLNLCIIINKDKIMRASSHPQPSNAMYNLATIVHQMVCLFAQQRLFSYLLGVTSYPYSVNMKDIVGSYCSASYRQWQTFTTKRYLKRVMEWRIVSIFRTLNFICLVCFLIYHQLFSLINIGNVSQSVAFFMVITNSHVL